MAEAIPSRFVFNPRSKRAILAKSVCELILSGLDGMTTLAKKRRQAIAQGLEDELILFGETSTALLESLNDTLSRDGTFVPSTVARWLREFTDTSDRTHEAARTFIWMMFQIWYNDHVGLAKVPKNPK